MPFHAISQFMNILTVKQQTKLQSILITYLEGAKKKNPQFGLRALAKKAELSPGALSEIMSGKRRVSINIAKRVIARLLIDPEISSNLFHQEALEGREEEQNSIQLTLDQYQVLSEWYYLAILNLIETKNFKNDNKIIAERLGLGLDVVKSAIERLFRLEMIELVRGKLKRTNVRYKTSEDLANLSIKKFHRKALSIAEEAMDTIPTEMRDFSAIILPADPNKLKQVKERIRRFQHQLIKEFEGEELTEVFQVSIQVFPLTKNINRG